LILILDNEWFSLSWPTDYGGMGVGAIHPHLLVGEFFPPIARGEMILESAHFAFHERPLEETLEATLRVVSARGGSVQGGADNSDGVDQLVGDRRGTQRHGRRGGAEHDDVVSVGALKPVVARGVSFANGGHGRSYDILDIRGVHRGRLDGDDGLAVAGDGISELGDLQYMRIAEVIKP
jgi:hypothetical protein